MKIANRYQVKLYVSIITALICVAAISAQNNFIKIEQDNPNSITIVISTPDIVIDSFFIEDSCFHFIKAPNSRFKNFGESANAPASLILDFALAIPSTKNVHLDIIEVDDTTIGDIKIAPYYSGCESEWCLDNLMYSSNDWLYKDIATVRGVSPWRSLCAAFIRFQLYSFNPSCDSLRIHRKVKLRLSADGDYGEISLESWLEDVYLSHFLNLHSLPYTLISEPSSYQVLYIYADHSNGYYEECAAKLAEFRYKQGWRVHSVNARDIYDIYDSIYPSESETTWIRMFIADTFDCYGDLSYVGLIGPDYCDMDSLPGMKFLNATHPPITESAYSLPIYLPQLGVGRIWAVNNYSAYGTEGFVDRIIQNESEWLPGGHWNDFMFVSQTTDIIYGYVDALAQESIIRSVGFDLTHYTCHDTTMGMLPLGTVRALNDSIVSALENDKYGVVWHFGHGNYGSWYKSGGGCCGSGEGALTSYNLLFHQLGYPTGVISGGCQTAREFGYEFTGRGALFYYGGITDGGDSHDFVSRIRAYQKLVGDAWRNYLIWSPRLLGDPLTRFYGPNEPSKYVVMTSPDCYYIHDDLTGDSLYVTVYADGPARWLHDTKICVTTNFNDDITPLYKVIPYGCNQVSFSSDEIAAALDLNPDEDTLYISCTKRDFITKTVKLPVILLEYEDSVITYNLNEGWNFISIPVEVCYGTLGEILPGVEQVLQWNPALHEFIDVCEEIPEPSKGYWARFSAPTDTFSIFGSGVLHWDIDVIDGWNSIGSISMAANSLPWQTSHTFTGSGTEISSSFVFYYDACLGYFKPSIGIAEGKGYFYNIRGNGALAFPESTIAPSSSPSHNELFDILCSLPNPPDSDGLSILDTAHMSVDIDWEEDVIMITSSECSVPIEQVLILIQVGDSIRFIFSESLKTSGEYALPFDIEPSIPMRLLIKKPGYKDFQILTATCFIENTHIWDDVKIFGQIAVGIEDTLFVLDGTSVTCCRSESDSGLAGPEIICEGKASCLYIKGTVENPISIGLPIGTIDDNLGGIFALKGGSLIIEHADIRNASVVEMVGSAGSCGACSLLSVSFIDCDNMFIDGDSCKSGARVSINDCNFYCPVELTGWRSLSCIYGSCFDGAPGLKLDSEDNSISVDNCIFQTPSSYGCQIEVFTSVEFYNCIFGGPGTAIINRGESDFSACQFNANLGKYNMITSEKSQTSARNCIFEGFTHACVLAEGHLDFGSGSSGHNCFYSDLSEWTFDGVDAVIEADFCYFDTLKAPDYIDLTSEFRDSLCVADSELSVIVCENGLKCCPNSFFLAHPVPNPFNTTVDIEFDVSFESYITIDIYNLAGIRIASIVRDFLKVGTYKTTWNGRSMIGDYLPSGAYFCKMCVITQNNDQAFMQTRKISLIK